MINLQYAASQIEAVWNMARGRPGWTEQLDRSVDGVFQSFAAMIYAAPFLAANAAAARVAARATPALDSEPIFTAPVSAFLLIQIFGSYVDWCATLFFLGLLARAVGASRRAAELIAGFNWLQVPLAGLQSLPAAAILWQGASGFGALLTLPVVVIAIALLWGYLRRALQLEPAWTLPVIILLTLIGLIAQNLATTFAFGLYQLFS